MERINEKHSRCPLGNQKLHDVPFSYHICSSDTTHDVSRSEASHRTPIHTTRLHMKTDHLSEYTQEPKFPPAGRKTFALHSHNNNMPFLTPYYPSATFDFFNRALNKPTKLIKRLVLFCPPPTPTPYFIFQCIPKCSLEKGDRHQHYSHGHQPHLKGLIDTTIFYSLPRCRQSSIWLYLYYYRYQFSIE